MEITGIKVETYQGEQAADFSEMMQGYEYGLYYYLSEVRLETLENEHTFNLEQLMEARFFSEDRELHLFQNEIGWNAVLVEETGTPEYLDEQRILSRQFHKAGRKICIRKYISYDEDGQAVVTLTRLCGVRGGN